MDKDKLKEIREKLDQTDRNIVDALARRQDLVREVSDHKLGSAKNIRDENREEQLLRRIKELARKAGLDRYFAEQIFRDIIGHSVRFQIHTLVDEQNVDKNNQQVRVAYQGTEGAYSEQAAIHHFEERYTDIFPQGYDTFFQAAQAVEKGEADYAILPIENTTAGSINDTYDILRDGRLHIVGEEALRIVHCLLTIEEVATDKVRRIFSHPQAIAQCSQFLAGQHRCKVESYIDTAMAAKKVLEDGDLSHAAIASAHAAKVYNLKIIERDIANQPENFTRFVIVSSESISVDLQIPCKTSLLMTTSHDRGSLLRCLNILEDHNINMAKLESRPKPNEPWNYQFYLDIEGNREAPAINTALSELRAQADSLKILGSYPAQVGKDD